jgi:hypothetical protein
MVYLILGMHKSGTTLVAQTFHLSGICMGDDLSDVDLDYSAEKAESRTARLINSQMLQSEGKYSLEIESLADPQLSSDTEEILREFVELHRQKYPKWGFKDPRTVLTYELWRDHLPEHKLVLIYRPLDQVWRHYTRDRLNGPKAFSLKTFRKGLRAIRAWIHYNQKLLAYSQQAGADSILINYDIMMSEVGGMEALGQFAETRLIDCRHSIAKPLTLWQRWIFALHRGVFLVSDSCSSLRQLNQELSSAAQ